MCGICGIWNNPDEASVKRMVDAMEHRGPDDFGVYIDPKVGLGMTRLSIIDTSPSGHQPMATPDRQIWIVFNGEIYNFKEERALLEKKGYTFKSSSDTEVVLYLYQEYGDACLNRLRGMFALAIYDMRKGPGRERLLLARDPMGIKPLLYFSSGNSLIFGSEIKTILASQKINAKINPEAIRLLMTFGSVYQPNTILEGVKALLPAHKLVIEDGQEHVSRYWSLGIDRFPDLRTASYEEQVEITCDVLDESVRMHAISDVPLGAFLSGGVDSSILVGLLSRYLPDTVKTFSVGYEQEGRSLDETSDAGRTADFLGTDHQRVVITGDDVRKKFDHFIAGLDQPSVDGMNSYFISEVARQAVTVAISGTGGDELFTGYPWFISMAAFEEKNKNRLLRNGFIKGVGRIARQPFLNAYALQAKSEWLRDLRNSSDLLAYYGTLFKIFDVQGTANILSPDMKDKTKIGSAKALDILLFDELPNGQAIERTTGLCLRSYTANQLLRDIDTCSMAHSLEIRVPFLDVVVANMALSLPISSKLPRFEKIYRPEIATYRESGSKKILVDAGIKLGLLRPDIVDQPKRGFSMPITPWLKGPLKKYMDEALSPVSVEARGIFNSAEVEKTQKRFEAGELSWVYPWLLMVTEMWCREVLDA